MAAENMMPIPSRTVVIYFLSRAGVGGAARLVVRPDFPDEPLAFLSREAATIWAADRGVLRSVKIVEARLSLPLASTTKGR